MYEIKKRIYPEFDKTQKSALCNYLRAFVKQNLDNEIDDIYLKFIENEKYYLEVNASRFSFIKDEMYSENFMTDTKLYLSECKKYYEYKLSQAPLIAKQKEYEKKKKLFLQELKMSKEKPTKKQLYYYDKLCKKYNIDKIDINKLSKLDIKNEIGKIIDEYSGYSRNYNK